MTLKEFEILRFIIETGKCTQRDISNETGYSLGTVNAALKKMKDLQLLNSDYTANKKTYEALEPYKVDNAIILAAGMSTRFVPISYEYPKGLTRVKGEVLIERQIRQLKDAGVKEIVIVVGHMMEKFMYLREKYGVVFVVNHDYKTRNTHSSVYAAREYLKNTYICCSDIFYPENLFHSYEYRAMYCGQFLEGESRTERGLIVNKNGLIIDTRKPCKDMWTMQGHAFFDNDFSRTFRPILEDYYSKTDTANLYWEGIYAENLDKLTMYMIPCADNDILEFDSVEDLRKFDPDFLMNNDLQVAQNICSVLNANPKEIEEIVPIKTGLTNDSFQFTYRDKKYVYRNPGKNTIGYIDRSREKIAVEYAKQLGIDDSYIFEDEQQGWKLSNFVNVTEEFDFKNSLHLSMLCEHLHTLHDASLKCGKEFDYFIEADKLSERLVSIDPGVKEHLDSLRSRALPVYEQILKDDWPVQLSHNDLFEPNLLVEKDKLYIIDWEYAGDTDIGFDLSKLFTADSAPFSEVDNRLAAYFGRKPTLKEKKHIVECACINYYYWYIWAIFQNRTGNNCAQQQLLWYEKMDKYYQESLHLQGGLK